MRAYLPGLPDPSAGRPPAVAGQFYPEHPAELRTMVNHFLASAKTVVGKTPKAIIAPHAGYPYSGPIAGSAYACLARGRDSIKRVILLGPSHFATFSGLAASSAKSFLSPLGSIPVDETVLARVCGLPQVTTLEVAHENEHSLEVQLPFLQIVLDRFKLVPLVVGDATADDVEQVFNELWGGGETSIVVSSDLSHYHDYQATRQIDRETARAIESLNWRKLDDDRACGYRGICGLLRAAKKHGLQCRVVDLRNSGDISGRYDRVVGYGAFVFTET
jgi:AmmeMemoRadiSam system protein B